MARYHRRTTPPVALVAGARDRDSGKVWRKAMKIRNPWNTALTREIFERARAGDSDAKREWRLILRRIEIFRHAASIGIAMASLDTLYRDLCAAKTMRALQRIEDAIEDASAIAEEERLFS